MYLQEYCLILPTYNNATTLHQVINDALGYVPNVIVVNDGSTDDTGKILSRISQIEVISYEKNKGKGYAIHQGMKKALSLGFRYAITMDTDGQHYASDIPLLVEVSQDTPDVLVIGSRTLEHENMPGTNSFANRFSNFWFHLQTLQKLPDTQSGFRVYPIKRMAKMTFICNRYEGELELLVKAAWSFIPIIPVKIQVYYAPEGERITHFRPFWDFFRISVLNTFLTLIAILYFYPKLLLKKIGIISRSK